MKMNVAARAVVAGGLLGTLAWVVGCSDQVAPREGDRPANAPMRPSFSSAQTFSVTLTPTISNADVGPLPLGTYQYPTLAVLKATGIMGMWHNTIPYWGTRGGTKHSDIDAGGTSYAGDISANVFATFNEYLERLEGLHWPAPEGMDGYGGRSRPRDCKMAQVELVSALR